MVYARFASGYRPGGPNTDIGPGVPITSQADKTENYEVGVKADFLDHTLSIDSSLYYIAWKNIQFDAQLLIGTVPYDFVSNGSAAKSQGVEISVASRPVQGLTITA